MKAQTRLPHGKVVDVDVTVKTYDDVGDMFLDHVPDYKGRGWRPFHVRFGWDARVARHMEKLSAKRAASRRASYTIPGELERAKEAIRFGVKKEGHGYKGDRGDFCLVGAVKQKKQLTLFYRRLELIGGLHYDLVLVNDIEKAMGEIRTVTIYAVEAKVFALRGNSNEKLYQKLRAYYA